ncbi:MAG: methylmalonyl-CoA mutase family protein, partial [Actinomycetota bacterium]
GGTQSLHTNALDEVLALPSEQAAAIALRTQQVIAYETGAANVADPLGGSWFVESLTNTMDERAEEYFRRIEALGSGGIMDGVLRGIEQGWFQQEIADAAYRYQKLVEKKRKIVVGVNDFESEGEPELEILRISADIERDQVASLAQVRSERDQAAVDKTLDALRAACSGTENTIPFIVDAVRAAASEGEIIGAMRDVFGDYRETPRF